MQVDITQENREAQVELLEQEGNHFLFTVDGRKYDLDVLMVEKGVYSVLFNGKSFNIETIVGDDPKKYIVNTIYTQYEIQIVDAALKYLRSRQGDDAAGGDSQITVPMPGKIVKVLAKPGQEVSQGETLVIVSAMKMESEYKAGKDGTVKDVFVQDGDTVDGGQVMVTLD